MHASSQFRPADRLDATGAILRYASFDLSLPRVLDSFIGLVRDAVEQQTCELRAILRRKFRRLLVRLVDWPAHTDILLAVVPEAMQMGPELGPGDRLGAAGLKVIHPPLDFGCPGLLDSLFGAFFSLFVQLFDASGHRRYFTAPSPRPG
jgi:hypothetical protein